MIHEFLEVGLTDPVLLATATAQDQDLIEQLLVNETVSVSQKHLQGLLRLWLLVAYALDVHVG